MSYFTGRLLLIPSSLISGACFDTLAPRRVSRTGGSGRTRYASGAVVGLAGTPVRGADDGNGLHRHPPPLPVRVERHTRSHAYLLSRVEVQKSAPN